MKKVLITGGAGFIGANLARKLISFPDFEIFIIEKRNTNLWRIKDIVNKINIKYLDLENSERLSKTVDEIKPNIVFHLASYGVYPSFQTDVRKMIRTNIEGTLNLINALKNHRISSFIYTGTCSEYNEKKSKLKENDPIDPLSMYAITKLTAGLLLKKIAQENNLPVINLRLFTPYGYYEDGQRLIPYIILNALRDKKIELSSPNYVRDFIFIEDLIDVFLRIMKSNYSYQGEIFNIGSGKQYRIKEVVSIVEKLLGKKLDVSYGARSSYYQEPKALIADNSKAKTAFNWRINHDFKSGIAKTIDWFRENKKFYFGAK